MNTIYIIIICSILAAIIGWRFYQKKLERSKNKIISTKNILEESIQKLQIAKQELANLKNLNENKIKELIQEKESAIANLQEKIMQHESKIKKQDVAHINHQLKDTPIYKHFVQIEFHPKETVTEDLWKTLEETMEKAIPPFIDIKHRHDINEKEYHICLLVRLGFSPSSISRFIGTSPSDITLSRKRMFKKICGKEGTAKELDVYICNL